MLDDSETTWMAFNSKLHPPHHSNRLENYRFIVDVKVKARKKTSIFRLASLLHGKRKTATAEVQRGLRMTSLKCMLCQSPGSQCLVKRCEAAVEWQLTLLNYKWLFDSINCTAPLQLWARLLAPPRCRWQAWLIRDQDLLLLENREV